MIANLETFLTLLWGTVVYRPYVYVFFLCFLCFGLYHLGWRRTFVFLVSTYLIAFACEYSSTRNGFPFGPYTYFDQTRTRELWISNVPFWDSLSFVFLSYFSYVLASVFTGERAGNLKWSTPVMGGFIMMLLDVVIDPVALQGEKWFLGRIYNYPYRGFYFGVTAANFAGWFFVGATTQLTFQFFVKNLEWCRGPWRQLHSYFNWAVFSVYAGVFVFNFGITVMIKDFELAKASALVSFATLLGIAVFILRDRRLRCGS